MAVSETAHERTRSGPLGAPWLVALPGIAALGLFHFVAIGFGAYYAFTKWNGLDHATWVGLANFGEIVSDRTAQAALRHTLILAGCFVVIVNALGLSLALALNRAVKTRHFLRVIFFTPVALSARSRSPSSGSGSSPTRAP